MSLLVAELTTAQKRKTRDTSDLTKPIVELYLLRDAPMHYFLHDISTALMYAMDVHKT